ncbi:MAG TPA: flagellar basal body rod protein FlgB [Caulobacterales bacterium]|nr:flagellar basal body rod protein FlgB [Caulobacterales bacterium]
MDLGQSPFFTLLRTRLGQLSERQRLISENIANASTPGYKPRDLDTTAFERTLAAQGSGGTARMLRTHPMHMTAAGATPGVQIVTRPDSETTIDGNQVVLEEEMARASETRMQFETGIALYQKGLQLLRLAVKAPGK